MVEREKSFMYYVVWVVVSEEGHYETLIGHNKYPKQRQRASGQFY